MSDNAYDYMEDIDYYNKNNEHSATVYDYQRQVSERKKREDAKKKEEQFLRRSLRQSEKMRALAQARKLAKQSSSEHKAAENLAFEGDDQYFTDSHDVTQWDVHGFLRQLRRTLERRKAKSPVAVTESPTLSDAEWNWLTEKLTGKSVLQAFNLHDVIASALETCRGKMGTLPYADWPCCDDALDEVDSTINYLSEAQKSTQSQDITNLLTILQNPKFRV
ncbi:unnamed protein product [Dibothriocephalus latus]|uniref:Uncharacterized protein n=1 Tax=Dibothriocephalus latus TaxID=60516 RepID=A0A3P7NSW0_DIBLA|nr:unnamed protein product [Dibothriocephalus latus]